MKLHPVKTGLTFVKLKDLIEKAKLGPMPSMNWYEITRDNKAPGPDMTFTTALTDPEKQYPMPNLFCWESNFQMPGPTPEEIEEYKTAVSSVTDLESGITYTNDGTGAFRAPDGTLLPGTEWNPTGRWQDIPNADKL